MLLAQYLYEVSFCSLSSFTNAENVFNASIRKLKNNTKSTIEANAY